MYEILEEVLEEVLEEIRPLRVDDGGRWVDWRLGAVG